MKELTKEKQKKIAALVLVLILLPLLLYHVGRAKKRSAPRLSPAKEAGSFASFPGGESSAPLSAAAGELRQHQETLTWRRNPFVLDLGGAEPTLQLRVSGIIFDETRPEATYAILNQEVVRIGDNLQGIKVVDIQPHFVRVKKFNQDLILYLHVEEEKE